MHDWKEQDVCERIRDKFVTGSWEEEELAAAGGAEDQSKPGKPGRGKSSGGRMAGGSRLNPDNPMGVSSSDFKSTSGDALADAIRMMGSMGDDDDEDDRRGGHDHDDDQEEEEGGDMEDEPKAEDDADGITVEGGESMEAKPGETEEEAEERRKKAKEKLKDKFNKGYDDSKDGGTATTYFDELKAQVDSKVARNKAEFADESEMDRFFLEGARPGAYVRIELRRVPCELVTRFDLRYPLVVGGLLPNETQLGLIQLRFKRHRWSKKILKSNDPLVFSLGWRRFQSLPIYSIEDKNERLRFLKYTPEHMHCIATLYGPVTPPNTGILAFQRSTNEVSTFRLSGTGVVVELDHTFRIVKKLKLTGHPLKVYKNTAYIKGMFSSALEVAKFEGAAIRTVSGIRGMIKRAVNKGPDGTYRATFEDKILSTDIVFCRTWTVVRPEEYYNPVTSLLEANKSKDWQGMRTVAQIRREERVPVPYKKDAAYPKEGVERLPRKFNPLVVPKNLQRDLPFAAKPKETPKRASNKPTLEQLRSIPLDAKERQAISLLQQAKTMKNVKNRKRQEQQERRTKEKTKRDSHLVAKRAASEKERRKEKYRKEGQQQKKRQKTG